MHHGRKQAMRERLTVHVLGGLDVAVGGRPLVELASAKARALLTYLAVTGTAPSRSALILVATAPPTYSS